MWNDSALFFHNFHSSLLTRLNNLHKTIKNITSKFAHTVLICVSPSQERQRLETILSLCSELDRTETDGEGATTSSTSTVADLRKINQELEKLQVNDDEDDDTLPVFLDSLAVNGILSNRHMPSLGSENSYYNDDLQVRQRRTSGHRDNRSESPAVSLRSFAPSPSPRMHRTQEV